MTEKKVFWVGEIVVYEWENHEGQFTLEFKPTTEDGVLEHNEVEKLIDFLCMWLKEH